MTADEFYAECRLLKRRFGFHLDLKRRFGFRLEEYVLLDSDKVLRLAAPPHPCPVCAVAWLKTSFKAIDDCYDVSARQINLDQDFAHKVVFAADGARCADPAVVTELYAACGIPMEAPSCTS